ncbi:unnamed protein product [Acanthoscelides obtectus]|uniref:Uncharacterized protein n=1 Tax=Acanthoscelides obtectus TaxID=200917 RepID=A0A9P0PX07_ACAOB|nr:unnamed protein product [Acanthoscelides obtectus]CAK1620544.1 hypothetical protein AOBTE_LOCUS439 [Acanthoscelides obtectus]
MSIGNITSGFRATGICPYDKDVLPIEAFAPSLATEKPYLETTAAADDSEYDSDDYLPLGWHLLRRSCSLDGFIASLPKTLLHKRHIGDCLSGNDGMKPNFK